jgi:hypothetical protein
MAISSVEEEEGEVAAAAIISCIGLAGLASIVENTVKAQVMNLAHPKGSFIL